MSDQLSWVDNKLVRRLQSRSVRPGVVQLDMGRSVVSRMEKMVKPQSLTQAVGQRWQNTLASQGEQIPFVYAQPPQMEADTAVSPSQTISQTAPTQKPTASPAQPELILAQTQQPSATTDASTAKTNKVTAVNDKTASSKKSARPTRNNTPKETAGSTQSPMVEPESSKNKKSQQQPVPTTSTSEPVVVSSAQLASAPTKTDLPLPVVTAQESPAPTTAVSTPPLPVVSKVATSPKTAVKGTPVNQSQPTRNAAVVVSVTKTATSTAPTMPVVPTDTNTKSAPRKIKKTTPVQIENNKIQTTTQPSLVTTSRPLVKPTPPAPKMPIIFPSATPSAPSRNGRTQPSSPLENPLPVVHSTQAPSSQMPSANMPLPKTAVTTPSSPPTTAPASTASANGVIQRHPHGDQNTAGNEADKGETQQESVDINEIVVEVHRQFKRELAIEGERRGATSWY